MLRKFLCLFITSFIFSAKCDKETVLMTEVFEIQVYPQMFNWTYEGIKDQFLYQPSLLNAPDLPSWINYVYSDRHHRGILYGVPPNTPGEEIDLEIIGLNRRDYSTKTYLKTVQITEKLNPAKHEVQLKIDNLNVEDMFEVERMERLKDIFRKKLWQDSENDLYVTFLVSAVKLGARLPLNPNEGEGVVLRLGSTAPLSNELIELQEEVKPLWKLQNCPRDFKRTTVERLFRENGFAMDWCTFRLEQEQVEGGSMKNSFLPSRSQHLEALQRERFDVLIIGGGATGAGCVLDSVTRGLKTALVEMGDFSSGTSSRSTKLIHGGVRYLQDAIMKFDREQFRMVKEALHERQWMLQFAPHLTSVVPIIIPVKKYWQLPYFWMGVKMYDLVAFGKSLKHSYVISKSKTLEYFPMLRSDQIVGSIVYHDGQMDDARMNIGVIMTAAKCGATVANYVKVRKLIYDSCGNLSGAAVTDEFTKKKWFINAKCVINATGPFTDSIRKMDNSQEKNICSPSSGVHIILPGYICQGKMGLLDPATSDGRVIFLLPWQKHTLVGTTDVPCKVTSNPQPTEAEINFILKEINNYFKSDCEVRRSDVLSAWSGIRPLVSDPNKKGTKSLARNHIIHVNPSKLITIAGGKWTTFRSMAEETINTAIKVCDLKPSNTCQTKNLILDGSQRWSPTMYIQLVQDHGISPDVAIHLSETYGCNAFEVIKYASSTGKHWPVLGKKLHEDFPYIEAEVRYGVREYACTAIDIIARRMRLSFLNVQVADEIAKKIVDIMSNELYWCMEEKDRQLRDCFKFLRLEMGLCTRKQISRAPIELSVAEVECFIQRFKKLDFCCIGYININDLRQIIGSTSEHNIMKFDMIVHKMDMNSNPNINLDEYLQIMSQLKTTEIESSRECTYKIDNLNMKNSP